MRRTFWLLGVVLAFAACGNDPEPGSDASTADALADTGDGPPDAPAEALATGDGLPDAATEGPDVGHAQPGSEAGQEGEMGPGAPPGPTCPPERCRFASVALGFNTTCLVEHDGTGRCFGRNAGESAVVPPGRYLQVLPLDGWNGVALTDAGKVRYFGGRNFATRLPEPRDDRLLAITGGFERMCGLRPDATVTCWGGLDRAEPPPGRFRSVAGWGVAFCGVREDREIACWPDVGLNRVAPPPGPWLEVSVASQHACALRPDGTVQCWGDNRDGELTVPAGRYTRVHVAGGVSCGLRMDGQLVCWGRPPDKQAGVHQPLPGTFSDFWYRDVQGCAQRPDRSFACWGPNVAGEASLPEDDNVARISGRCFLGVGGGADCWGGIPRRSPGPFLDVAGSSDRGCTLDADGRATCWSPFTGLDPVPPAQAFSTLRVTGFMACGLRRMTGEIDCWGAQLRPEGLPPAGRYRDFATSEDVGCALREDRTLICWDPDGQSRIVLDRPAGTFETVSLHGDDRGCATNAAGQVTCWGRASATDLPPGSYRQVAVGDDFSVALRTDGTLVGFGSIGPLHRPTLPAGTFKQLGPVQGAEGGRFSCGLETSGRVRCWGAIAR
jgi:hypothetical protein